MVHSLIEIWDLHSESIYEPLRDLSQKHPGLCKRVKKADSRVRPQAGIVAFLPCLI